MTKQTPEVIEFLEEIKKIRNYIGIVAPQYLAEYAMEEDRNNMDAVLDLLNSYDSDLKLEIIRDHDIKIVEQEGGNEGDDAQHHWFVLQYKDKFFRVPGYYSSYENNEYYWESTKQVSAKTRPITYYEDI